MPLPTQTERQRLRTAPGLATFTIALVGLLAANLSPLMLIALGDIGIGSIQAGAYMTAHLLATAVTALGTMRWVAGPGRRAIGRAGAAAALLGYGAAALISEPGTLLIVALIVAGLGAGATASAGGAALAAFEGSNRVVGLNVLFNRGANAVILAVVPAVGLSMLSAFGSAALVCAIAFALVGLLPQTRDLSDSTIAVADNNARPVSRPTAIAGFALLACFAVWALSEDSLWAIAGVMGADQAQLSDQLLGTVLSLSTVGGLLGALLVVVAGAKLPRSWALMAMLLLGGGMKLGSAYATEAILYAALLIGWNFIYGVAYAYFVATAAGLDASGRWSGPIVGAYLVGSSFAPLFATTVSEGVGYHGFGLVIGGLSVLLIAPVMVIARLSMRTEAQDELVTQNESVSQ